MLFRHYFGADKEVVRARAPLEATATAELQGQTDKLLWVNGDLELSANSRLGCSLAPPEPCPVAAADPVILVVDGNLTASGTVEIYGVVFITGDWEVQGNFSIQGAVIVAGSVGGSGNLEVVFEPTLVAPEAFSPLPAALTGTWRDW